MSQGNEYIRTVTTKGQVTIPVEIRRALDMNPGDKIVFRVTDDTVELQPAPMSLEDTFGAVQPQNRPEDFDALRDTAVEEHAKRTIEEM